MDTRSNYSLSVLAPLNDGYGEPRTDTISRLKEFILAFQIDGVYIYRDQIRENVLVRRYYCDVDVAHIISYNEDLAHKLTTDPTRTIPLFETALKQCTQRIVYPQKPDVELPQHQLMLHSSVHQISVRDLTADNVSALVRIPGIVIGASTLSSKATVLAIECRSCQHRESLVVEGGFTGITLPRICGSKNIPGQTQGEGCGLDPYFVVHEDSQFQDQQILKLQEAPDQVPVGELPRHIVISADRYLVNRVIPGSRCTVMGVYSIYQQNTNRNKGIAIRNPYLRAVGIVPDIDHSSSASQHFTEEEILEFEHMARDPDIYRKIANSIAPSIYGNVDIKKAIACLLMGGSKKVLPDGMKLRGDINVLLLGDPGTAKSQLLKFVEKVAPIAIYTSGKGSSAAGLTASVQRDTQSREFYLEGGAMVLADGGVVCIDEFDKMRDEDRVAIHEAMEQQTISIAKAGITTILNARTSVLAAANPIFGRYDDLKSPGENIDFQTTILSRFDMIFIVRDDHDRNRDERIARHVMGIHMGTNNPLSADDTSANQADISVDKLKRYISFCKARCAPRLSKEATEKLSSHFVTIRAQTARHERGQNLKSSIPITIRQLEAIIRITESLAKLRLSPVADESHVDEAIRLFLASTMDAVTHERAAYGGGAVAGAGAGNRDIMAEIGRLEEEIKKRLPIGWTASLSKLRKEFVDGKGYSDAALGRALGVMQRRESIRMRGGGGGGLEMWCLISTYLGLGCGGFGFV